MRILVQVVFEIEILTINNQQINIETEHFRIRDIYLNWNEECDSLVNILERFSSIFSLLFDIFTLLSACLICQCFGDNFIRKSPYLMYSLRRNSVFDISLLKGNENIIRYICVKACSLFIKRFLQNSFSWLCIYLTKIPSMAMKIGALIKYEIRRNNQ